MKYKTHDFKYENNKNVYENIAKNIENCHPRAHFNVIYYSSSLFSFSK